MLKNFRGYQLAVQFYQITRELRAPDGLRDQLGRAASSVALNLAEGSGKSSPKDRKRFYEIALGSVRECEAIMDLLQIPDDQIRTTLDKLARNTFTLCRALQRG
jgi:four helix bundle protein